MKRMNVPRGTARAGRRTSRPTASPSATAQRALLADMARLNFKLNVQLFKKAATARFARHSPFA